MIAAESIHAHAVKNVSIYECICVLQFIRSTHVIAHRLIPRWMNANYVARKVVRSNMSPGLMRT